MRVAVGQFSADADKAENLQTMVRQAEEAASKGAELIVFPEYAMYKQVVRDAEFLDACEPLDGAFATALKALSKRLKINIVAGLVKSIEGERRGYNTVVAIGQDGNHIGLYRKVHLYDSFGGKESEWIRPGGNDQPLVVRIGGITFGLMICYDVRFPEIARQMVDEGAEVILLPTAWTPGVRKEDHWTTLIRARAIENTAYVIGANIAPPMSTGGSLVVDPMGIVIAEMGETSGVAVGDIEPERVREVRRKNPSLQHRRYRVARLASSEWLADPVTGESMAPQDRREALEA